MPTPLNVINEDPLAHFDALLRNTIPDLEEVERRDEMILCLMALAGYPAEHTKNASKQITELLASQPEIDDKQTFIACVLLSLPAIDAKWLFDGGKLRPHMLALMNDVLSPEIYAEQKFDISKQTHEKFPLLGEMISRFDQQVADAVAELTSLDRLRAHRHKLARILNSHLAQLLLGPFAPKNYFQKLNELYTKAEKYVSQRNSLEVVTAFEEAFGLLDVLENEFNECDSYCTRRIRTVLEDLKRLLQTDFSANEAAQPANLVIDRNNKKYPFDQVGKTIDLVFSVRNVGSGYGYSITIEALGNEPITPQARINLPRIPPGEIQTIQIPATINQYVQQVELLLIVEWQNYGGTELQTCEKLFVIDAQRSDISWNELERSSPYSLTAVRGKEDLIGRTSDLNSLIALSTANDRIESAYITGQKRVGKTSIAKALYSQLTESNFITIYLEGDYIKSTPEGTIQYLGQRICRLVKKQEPRVATLEIPEFVDDLVPLRDFLDDVIELVQRRIVIILDEFDEIPTELYSSLSLANAFFMVLRSTSSRPEIGFILVGGEKMEHIFQSQGMHLNKWKRFPVDYFDFNLDYRDLVERPVDNLMEFSQDALELIYQSTAGNPYFTKLLCGHIFSEAVRRRDCYITGLEVKDAIRVALSKVGANTFQHFWDDGIDKRAENIDERRERRRRLLVAVSDAMLNKMTVSSDEIIASKLLVTYGRTLIEAELNEFVRRKILVAESPNIFRFKVPLFQEWLQSYGTQEVLASFPVHDLAVRERIQDEELRVKPREVIELIQSWGTQYKGLPITTDSVHYWLEQFGTFEEQRAMFNVLRSVKFYSDAGVRNTLLQAHKSKVTPGLVRQVSSNQRKRTDILVSYLVGVGKSGANLARLYASECDIRSTNVVERNKLPELLEQPTPAIKALVFADDFLGTGTQLSKDLKALDLEIAHLVKERRIRVVIIIAVATLEGQKKIEGTIEDLTMDVELYIGDILGEESLCFSPTSKIYPSDKDREFARLVAKEYGEAIFKHSPLGYGDLGLAVVFQNSCPNNTLPILWSDGKRENTEVHWRPLFKR